LKNVRLFFRSFFGFSPQVVRAYLPFVFGLGQSSPRRFGGR
jgi:hypothetical protein